MSTCISRSGEYSDHEPGDWCPRCGAFNEEAIVAERDAAVRELRDRELHHFESEKAMTEALAEIEDTLGVIDLWSWIPERNEARETLDTAGRILKAALGSPEPTEPEPDRR